MPHVEDYNPDRTHRCQFDYRCIFAAHKITAVTPSDSLSNLVSQAIWSHRLTHTHTQWHMRTLTMHLPNKTWILPKIMYIFFFLGIVASSITDTTLKIAAQVVVVTNTATEWGKILKPTHLRNDCMDSLFFYESLVVLRRSACKIQWPTHSVAFRAHMLQIILFTGHPTAGKP